MMNPGVKPINAELKDVQALLLKSAALTAKSGWSAYGQMQLK
jgi:hypothetical protein